MALQGGLKFLLRHRPALMKFGKYASGGAGQGEPSTEAAQWVTGCDLHAQVALCTFPGQFFILYVFKTVLLLCREVRPPYSVSSCDSLCSSFDVKEELMMTEQTKVTAGDGLGDSAAFGEGSHGQSEGLSFGSELDVAAHVCGVQERFAYDRGN